MGTETSPDPTFSHVRYAGGDAPVGRRTIGERISYLSL